MFALARGIVRHKVGAVAVICFAAVMFSSDKDDEQPASRNPWAVQAAAPAEEPGVFDSAVDAGMEYLDETGMNPVSHGRETAERIDGASAALGEANRAN